MVDGNGSGVNRIADLVDAYRSILRGYEEIERLSREERDRLRDGGDLSVITTILRSKTERLAEVRDEEGRVKSAREWWRKVRRTLPGGAGRDLLSLLDAISRSVELSLELEAECRRLLESRSERNRATPPEPAFAGAPPASLRADASGRKEALS